jgi:hypothetical protein
MMLFRGAWGPGDPLSPSMPAPRRLARGAPGREVKVERLWPGWGR